MHRPTLGLLVLFLLGTVAESQKGKLYRKSAKGGFTEITLTCEAGCLNGGRCFKGRCVCPPGFRGSSCQYTLGLCDPRTALGFIGEPQCNHTARITKCSLSCMGGFHYASLPPADIYTCAVDGKWTPPVAPRCIRDREDRPASSARPKRSSGTCAIWGRGHYRTFDGSMYSFRSHCRHLLAHNCKEDLFSIHVNDLNCTEDSCLRSVEVYVEGQKYSFELKPTPRVLFGDSSFPIPTTLEGLRVKYVSDRVLISSDIGFSISWDGEGLVELTVIDELKGNMCGLCGQYDGDPSNDFVNKHGRQVTSRKAFLESWEMNELGEECEDIFYNPSISHKSEEITTDARRMCSNVERREYDGCHQVADPIPYEHMCIDDFEACQSASNGTCMCDTLAEYFRECQRLGGRLERAWRDPAFCAAQCPPGMIYSQCGASCQKTCRDPEPVCGPEDCIEGCQCAEGTYLHNGNCLPREDCPCLLHGREYTTGERVEQECNACECKAGEWQCTTQQCPSRCIATGNPLYSTFDGKAYEFSGKCPYYLLKSDNFTVVQETGHCASGLLPDSSAKGLGDCFKIVTATAEDDVVVLKRGEVIVNGLEAMLPFSNGRVTAYLASSEFIKVHFANGVILVWDRGSRLYIDSPVSLSGRFRGLCGTNNLNQKDDFVTEAGDVEVEVTSFANKWKASDACEEVEDLDSHPCYMVPQRLPETKQLCYSLKRDVFERCHSVVDPEPYYKMCVHRTCSCKGDVPHCVCPAFAEYAAECARKGVVVNWREHFAPCSVRCPEDQTWNECNRQSSCYEVSVGLSEQTCVEGCACTVGYLKEGTCVLMENCPCVYKNKELPPGRFLRTRGELCECAAGLLRCFEPGMDMVADVNSSLALLNIGRTIRCPDEDSMEYTPCLESCPRTCDNHNTAATCDTDICQPGCRCKAGFVLDLETKKCIPEGNCGCKHGGRMHEAGSVIRRDCNKCTCRSGRWECQEKDCPGVCTAWGESHFNTFDGRIFDFRGDCEYVMIKGRLNDTTKIEVVVQSVPCASGNTVCRRVAKVVLGEEVVTLGHQKKLPSVKYGTNYVIRETTLQVTLYSPLGIIVEWDKGTRVAVQADPVWAGRVRGICGNYNGNQLDDFQTPSGGLSEGNARIFADSWKVQEHCPDTEVQVDFCDEHPNRATWAAKKCEVLYSDLFQPCHSAVEVEPYYDRCLQDVCSCDSGGDCECLCTNVAAYAHECSAQGIPIRWRSQELCPIQCDGECSEYHACVPACPPKTCEMLTVSSQVRDLCDEEICFEGCLPKPCPPGFVYNNERELKCIPESQCQVPCREINGRLYYEGDRILDEAIAEPCESCFCQHNAIVCTGHPCPTPTPPLEVECLQTGWTPWYNALAKASGRFALLGDAQFVAWYTQYCGLRNITDIQCRVQGTEQDASEGGQKVACQLPRGLACYNRDQADGTCLGYQVRLLCECAVPTTTVAPTTTPVPTTTPAPTTTTTQPPPPEETSAIVVVTTTPVPETTTFLYLAPTPPPRCVSGWTEFFNIDRPDTGEGDVETVADITRNRDFCPGGLISDIECKADVNGQLVDYQTTGDFGVKCSRSTGLLCVNWLQPRGKTCHDYSVRFYCTCEEVPAVPRLLPVPTTLPTTTTQPTTTTTAPPEPVAEATVPPVTHCYPGWSAFFDIDKPTTGAGDFEILENMHGLPCALDMIGDIECKAVSNETDELLEWEETRDNITCSVSKGLTCFNHDQSEGRMCHNYKIRVYCSCGETTPPETTTPEETTPSTLGTTTERFVPPETTTTTVAETTTPVATTTEKTTVPPTTQATTTTTTVAETTTPLATTTERTTVPPTTQATTTTTTVAETTTPLATTTERTTVPPTTQPITTTPPVPTTETTTPLEIEGRTLPVTTPEATTTPPVVTETTTPVITTVPSVCPPGQVYSDCAYRCDQMCSAFLHLLIEETKCGGPDICIPGCRPDIQCDPPLMWHDYSTCISIEECSCAMGDQLLGPYQIADSDCYRCICINNSVNCEGVPGCRTIPPESQERGTETTTPLPATTTETVTEAFVTPEEVTTPPIPAVFAAPAAAPERCSRYVYLVNGPTPLPASKLSASSSAGPTSTPDHARLGSVTTGTSMGAWIPRRQGLGEFVEVDLGEVVPIYGVATQGRDRSDQWVTRYRVLVSEDGDKYFYLHDDDGEPKEFVGNHDPVGVMRHVFMRPVRARFVRIEPTAWNSIIALRFDILGCQGRRRAQKHRPRTTQAPLTTPPEYVPVTILCPELPGVLHQHCPQCPANTFCDGLSCVSAVDCPCFQDSQLFRGNQIVETSTCDVCVCTLYGHSECSKKECSCPAGQRPSLDHNCKCKCEYCPMGQMMCPTSQECIDEKKWCNGVKDCPDDETDCPPVPPATQPCPRPRKPSCPAGQYARLVRKNRCPEYMCVPGEVEEDVCTLLMNAGTCSLTGNTMRTFDGQEFRYEVCDHVLMQDKEQKRFSVTVHKQCMATGGCMKSLSIKADDVFVKLGPSLSDVAVNGMLVHSQHLETVSRRLKEVHLSVNGKRLLFRSLKHNFQVALDVHQDVKIGLSECLTDRTNGMCGPFNYDPADDFQMPDGHLAPNGKASGDSWATTLASNCRPSTCPPDVRHIAHTTCSKIKDPSLGPCLQSSTLSTAMEVCEDFMCECLASSSVENAKHCSCEAIEEFVATCDPQTRESIGSDWRLAFGCTPECPKGTEWRDCGPACEKTCENLHEKPKECPEECVPGCFCPQGLVRRGDVCVPPNLCHDCVCRGHGDPNYITFDGHYYDFQGSCSYVLAQHVSSDDAVNFQVVGINVECPEEPHTTCTDGVIITYKNHYVKVAKGQPVTVDDQELQERDFPWSNFGFNVTWVPGRSSSVSVPAIDLVVRYFELNYGFSVELPSFTYFNKTEGLCGVCNFDSSDDLTSRHGTVTDDVSAFAYSWLLEGTPEICNVRPTPKRHVPPEICEFQRNACDLYVDPDQYKMACANDAGHSRNLTASVCRSKLQFATTCCSEGGISIHEWLKESGCLSDCPMNMELRCGSDCVKTCANYKSVDEEVCAASPSYGCFCKESFVLKEGKCVKPRDCEACDAEGHLIGDKWSTGPCETCECTEDLKVRCTTTLCPPPPICRSDEQLRHYPKKDGACCDDYKCETKSRKGCRPSEPAKCVPGAVSKLQIGTDGCPSYVCECDIEQCPPMQWPTDVEPGLEPFVESHGCCKAVALRCNVQKCPEAPRCPPEMELQNVPGECCTTYKCVTTNKCAYMHRYKVVNGMQVQLHPDQQYLRMYPAGSTWMDGLCTNCSCTEQQGQYQYSCNVEVCPSHQQDSEDYEYVVDTESSTGTCCVKQRRLSCMGGGRVHPIGTQWHLPGEENCRSYRCERSPSTGEALKVTVTQICNDTCPASSKYEPPLPGSNECCGRCVPQYCEESGKLYQVGEVWPSTTIPCFQVECAASVNGSVKKYKMDECPPLPPNCPRSNIVRDAKGCCQICKITPGACQPQTISLDTSTQYFSLFDPTHGHCENTEPIPELAECRGQCYSRTKYRSSTDDFESICRCCTIKNYVSRKVALTCEDGTKVMKQYKNPTECSCTTCGEEPRPSKDIPEPVYVR